MFRTFALHVKYPWFSAGRRLKPGLKGSQAAVLLLMISKAGVSSGRASGVKSRQIKHADPSAVATPSGNKRAINSISFSSYLL